MKTLLILILIAAVIGGGVWIATKYFGAFSDTDKDGIPDKVEDTYAKGKAAVKETKRRARNVKKELGDVVDQAKDVVDAAKGGSRRGRKPKS
jgi:hypothetical protein